MKSRVFRPATPDAPGTTVRPGCGPSALAATLAGFLLCWWLFPAPAGGPADAGWGETLTPAAAKYFEALQPFKYEPRNPLVRASMYFLDRAQVRLSGLGR